MMNNLFSMFDPSSTTMSTAWTTMIFPIMIINQNKQMILSKWNKFIANTMSPIFKEINPLLGISKKNGILPILMGIFMTILLMNMMALTPFVFTPTAHIIVSFTSALILWLSMMMFGWINNTKNMMAHTVPTGTPMMLLNFMVLIELVSNVIRPITLSIRLSANMVAGHLLLSLLGNFSLLSSSNMIMSSIILLMLTGLELGVAMIQAYVFMTLMTLYSTEIH